MLARSLTLACCLAACLPVAAQTLSSARHKAPTSRPAAAAPGLPSPTLDQLEAAKLVHLGDSSCDEHPLVVKAHATHEGYMDVAYRKLRFVMKPVLSSTGALRLEDVQGRALLLQIAYKSMLMDTRAGKRLADNCVHEVQAAAERAAAQSDVARPRLLVDPAQTPAAPQTTTATAAPVPAAAASQSPV